ncbi:helix-turn-helix domain-containing protein [Clostridium cylindrosporum]|uniref:Transcriptional regulatory protein n=1 Tax=Clostridium cylindrosporum DSM 605 TaxID=1121307 RepID=A0A0J8D558_CLOCY|nr:XRE family transcriptional regulator [Clostridium cylindrosporum]KMT20952.1 transcriptional regulatory protein [Clostridium cylindrosporum DSM 605]
MDLSIIIADNLKFLRQERNLSLGQLAELSGISKVMLSQIEKGESNPTINTIWKIATGLKVPYTRLIDEPSNDTVVVRKCSIKEQFDNNDVYKVYCYYTNNPNRNFEFFKTELSPNSSSTSAGHSLKSREYIFVIKGELILRTSNEEYILQKDDSINFDASLPHFYLNNQNDIVEFIVINYYP